MIEHVRGLFRLAAVSGVVFSLLVRTLAAQVVDSRPATGAGKVEIRVNGRVVKEATIQSGEVSIDTVRVTVRAGDEVKTLLKRQGIVPDAAAIARFYELNPAVRNADALTVGSSVLLPAVRNKDSTAAVGAGRVTYALLADTTYKALLLEKANMISQLSDSLKLSGTKLSARSIDANADKIAGAVHTLVRAPIPMSRETAAEFSYTLDTYQLQMQEALKTGGPAREQLSQSGAHVVAEATAMATASRSGTNRRVELEVDVIDTSGNDLGNVKIVYVRPMLESDPAHFESFLKRQPSRAKNPIDLGPWRMWVEDLSGNEVSVKRELVKVTNPSRVVTLVVRGGG